MIGDMGHSDSLNCGSVDVGVFQKLLYSQSVSLQHVDSQTCQTGHREVGQLQRRTEFGCLYKG